MKILVVGGGGREHALAWKLKQSPRVEKIFAAPGNAGMAAICECRPLDPADLKGLADLAGKEQIDLTVVGPEIPLAAGIVDEFQGRGLPIFGPSREAAELEGSKVFAKKIMEKYQVPTGKARVFTDPEKAREALGEFQFPVVVKADGLAAGKGVIICPDREEALAAIDLIMGKRAFGASGDSLILEEYLEGEEVSVLAFSDGCNILPMVSSQDHKAVYDGDKGPNTGGMGAYSPAPVVDAEMEERIRREVLEPVVSGMAKEGRPYVGVLYAGLMITAEGPKVLEFNVRFGDPETQATLPLLKTDLLVPLQACLEGHLPETEVEWDPGAAICVVLASGGYPGEYEKGKEISGLEKLAGKNDAVVFHAGTSLADGKIVTSGGRVLGVTAVGSDIRQAIGKAYEAVGLIDFEGVYFRRDIGHRALSRLK